MFHISDVKKYTRCPVLYLKEQTAPKREYHPFVRLDEQITDLAARKLGVDGKSCFIGKRNDDPSLALEAMKDHDWLMKARFSFRQLRVKVPFLHRHDDGWDLYFLYVGIWPHTDDMQFYRDMVWVLENNHILLKDIRLIHLNAHYVRGKELDVSQLFTVSDYFYNGRNNPTTPVKDAIFRKKTDLSELLNEMENCTPETAGKPVRTKKCAGRSRCRYYASCFPDETVEPDNSILTLIAAQHRYEMKREGRTRLKDADPERIEGSRQQYAQILADQEGGTHVDVLGLRAWLSHIQYPVSFLDFEWERFAVPPYEGMKPYDVLPFEYALYIMQEDGSVTHRVYLNVHDDRRNMAESLVRDIPENGSVIAYNAEGAEKIRISEFAALYPDLSEKLLAINERMEDLQLPFEGGTVYDVRMRGTWSLKAIMNMMDDPGYNELDIRQGMDAVWQWRHLDYDDDMPLAEKQKIVDDLKKYCGMDAYAMTVVYRWLLKLAGQDPE